MRNTRVLGPALAALALVSCTSQGRLPDLPTSADYARACPELFEEYRTADGIARERKIMSTTADSAIAVIAIAVTIASGGSAGPAVPIAAIVISQAKGDFGYEKMAVERATIQQMAMMKGCTREDSDLENASAPLPAEPDAEVRPAASNDHSKGR